MTVVVAGPPAVEEIEVVWRLAQRLSGTEFVPSSLRDRPNAVLAAILTGREIGIGPMQALQSINVIQGKPTLAPELMRALVYRAGHRMDVLEHTDQACTVKGVRSDSGAEASVRWTMDDAQRAHLAGKGAWVTYPRAMLLARATSELCRLVFADVIAGVSYTPEEIGGDLAPEQLSDDVDVQALGSSSSAGQGPPEIDEAEIVSESVEAPGAETGLLPDPDLPGGTEAVGVPVPHGYDNWSKDDLVAECQELELPYSGTKDRLVKELRAWDVSYRPEYEEPAERPF